MKNLVTLYRSITDPSTIEEGLTWYRTANRFCQQLAERENLPLAKVVGVFAALSPGTNYEQNKRDAVNLITGKRSKFTTYGQNVAKAREILASDLNPLLFFSMTTGPKTYSFYLNVLDPDGHEVTVDRHAYRVATGGEYKGLKAKEYRTIADHYRKAAEVLGVRPLELQAVLWINYRREQEIAFKQYVPF